MCGVTARPIAGGGGGGAAGGAAKGVFLKLSSWLVPVVYNGTIISAARITPCKPVAAAHSRGLLRTLFVVGICSNASRKTSFCVVEDSRTGRARSPARPFKPESKRCIGSEVIAPPLFLFDPRKSPSYALRPPSLLQVRASPRRPCPH